jgi:hypothetical protein
VPSPDIKQRIKDYVPVKWTELIEVLEMFLGDTATEAIVMIGETGGSAEEDAAAFLIDEAKRGRKKPMVGFIAGRTAPPGGAWATPAPSSPGARATPNPRSRPWKPPASGCRRRRRGWQDLGRAVAGVAAAQGIRVSRVKKPRSTTYPGASRDHFTGRCGGQVTAYSSGPG